MFHASTCLRISAAGAQDLSSEDAEVIVKQDIKALKLSHIHGYRGYDCRDNLFYINDGNMIVYHAAAAGIVCDLATSN